MLDCPSRPELALDEWSRTLLDGLGGKRYPINGQMELTDRCNLTCVHCYINQPAGCQAALSRELTTEQVLSILDQIADAGCLFLVLTGGEPLIRPDFPEIYLHARKRGMVVTLFTNATLLTEPIADMLAYYRPQLVDITIYGASQEIYESVTRVRGSYERCMRGIQLLAERKIPFSLKTILLTLNRHELGAMRDLADELGVNFRYDGTIWPRGDGDERPYQYRLPVEDLQALDHETPERISEWKRMADEFKDVMVRNEYTFSCGAGLRSFDIDSHGYLSICTMVSRPAYDLKTIKFNEAWKKIGELRQLKRERHTICETCTVGALCFQCPGWSQLVHGDNETPVDYVCRLGHLRAGQFNNEMIELR
jgi:radical SAM protein with 4Fe4S-binding SPASM domain